MAKLTEDERLFRKIEGKIKRAILDYGSVNDGNRILIKLSGGKGSSALADLLGRRSRIYRSRFEVAVVHIMMTNIPCCSDREHLRNCTKEHDLPFIVHEIGLDPSTNTHKSPCFLCSQTRRKALLEITKARECSKIVLGHHQDDILGTLPMNLTHQGALGTMSPRLRMNKFDMETTRPMCLVEERELIQVAAQKGCRKQLRNCPYKSGPSRSDTRELLRSLKAISPEARHSLWRSVANI